MLVLPLADLLAVVREFLNPNVSRSGLDRCLRRHGVSRLRDLKPKAAKPAHKPFKAYVPGYLHIDAKYLPQMADEDRRRYLFAAIDRATRWVFIRIYAAKTAANARRFLRDLDRAAPMKITRVLPTMARNSPTGCSASSGGRQPAPTSLTCFAPSSASTTAWPRQGARRQMAWSSGSTAGSRTSCKVTGSAAESTSSRPSYATSASILASSPIRAEGACADRRAQELASREPGALQKKTVQSPGM
jgi:hypothetical protein